MATPETADPRVGEILAIVAREASIDVSALRLGARIDEVGLQSLDIVQSIFELENHFNVEIPVIAERAGAEFTTIGDLVAHVLATLDRSALPRGPAPEAMPG